MPAPPLKTEISDTYPNPSNAVARVGFAKLWETLFGAAGLLGSTGNAADARTALGVPAANNAELTGNPTVTTQIASDNSSRIANTAWVRSAIGTIATAAGFASSFGTDASYIKMPSWLGGWIVQWGSRAAAVGGGSAIGITYPLTFPTTMGRPVASNGDWYTTNAHVAVGAPTASGFDVVCTVPASGGGFTGLSAALTVRVNWISIGR